MSDPVEAEVFDYLDGLVERPDNGLDFYLPEFDLYVECKRFYTPRIAEQLSRVPEEKVIVVQGKGAFTALVQALHRRDGFTK